MKRQRSFADQEYEKFRKKTRREQFLEDMKSVTVNVPTPARINHEQAMHP